MHRHGEVFGVDRQHLVHAAHVDADAALHRQQVAFQRRAHTKRDHRHLVLRGQLYRVGHVLCALGEHHGGGRGHFVHRLVAPMLFAHHQGGGALGAETLLQLGDECVGGGALVHVGRQMAQGGGGVHGLSPESVGAASQFTTCRSGWGGQGFLVVPDQVRPLRVVVAFVGTDRVLAGKTEVLAVLSVGVAAPDARWAGVA